MDEGLGQPLLADASPAGTSTGGGPGATVNSSPSGPICLICQEVLTPEELEAGEAISLQCACRGEMAMRHRKCAIEHSAHKGSRRCDVCKQPITNLPPIPPKARAPIFASIAATGSAMIKAIGMVVYYFCWTVFSILALAAIVGSIAVLWKVTEKHFGVKSATALIASLFVVGLITTCSLVKFEELQREYRVPGLLAGEGQL